MKLIIIINILIYILIYLLVIMISINTWFLIIAGFVVIDNLFIYRIEREGSIKICINCGSTMTRSGFLKIFGELLCDNKKCPNSIKKYK